MITNTAVTVPLMHHRIIDIQYYKVSGFVFVKRILYIISHSYNYIESQQKKQLALQSACNIADLGFDVESKCLCQYHRYLSEIKMSWTSRGEISTQLSGVDREAFLQLSFHIVTSISSNILQTDRNFCILHTCQK